MFSLFSTLTKPRNLRAYLPISYESARNLVVTKLEAGAAAGNNTAMAFNREISKGELWDWLPISENLYSFLTKVFLTFPNDEVKNVIVKLVEKDTDFDPRQINLNFLDPNEVFSTHWKEITNNLVELFTESDLLTGELAIQRFFKAYNAKTTIKSDLITFAPACVGSYVATLQGLYLNYVLKEIRAHDGNRIVNTPNAQILIDYYSELLKKLFAKTIAEVRLQVGEAIDKKIIEDNNKTELQNIFDAKIISPPEKDFIIDMVDKFDIDSDSLLSRMTEDIKDFYSADVSYLDRYFLLKMLEKNYGDDPDCREHIMALHTLPFTEVVEGIGNNLQLEKALTGCQSEDSTQTTNSTISSNQSTPRSSSPSLDIVLPEVTPKRSSFRA